MCNKMKSSFVSPEGIFPVFQDRLSICGHVYSSSPVDGRTCLRPLPVQLSGMLWILWMINNDPECLSVFCWESMHTRMVKRRQGEGYHWLFEPVLGTWFFILKTKPQRSSNHHAIVEHKVVPLCYFLNGRLYFGANLPPSRSVCCQSPEDGSPTGGPALILKLL